MLRNTRPQSCSRCKAVVPADRKSCPIASRDTYGDVLPAQSKAQPRPILLKAGILTFVVAVFAFWMWGGLVSLQAYDRQAILRDRADLVQVGMTHRQVTDLLGRDAVPIPVVENFQRMADQSVRGLSDDARYALETRKVSACSPDRDAECGAYYTIKDGSGLRMIYRRGIVIYASISYGYGRRGSRYAQ